MSMKEQTEKQPSMLSKLTVFKNNDESKNEVHSSVASTTSLKVV
jgi:hypothetical protein